MILAMRRTLTSAFPMIAAVVIVAVLAPMASAEAVEEAPYGDGSGKEAAEMVCATYSHTYDERWSRKLGVFYKSESPVRMRRRLRWAGEHLRKTYRQLRALSWPAEDSEVIGRWLKRVRRQPVLTERLAEAVGVEPLRREVAQLRVTINGEIANGIVAPFGFHYCLFDSAGLLG